MILGVMTFSKRGQKTAEDLFEKCKEISPLYYDGDMPREAWIRDKFSYHIPLLFVGATGIAVRLIAPFVEDKLRDSAVIVMDQRGRHVIPLLSGHMGGANEIARNLADRVGAEIILTTATDVEDLFAVDVFARRNGFCICDRAGIRRISQRLLEGEKIRLAIDPAITFFKEDLPEGLHLVEASDGNVDLWIGCNPLDQETDLQLIHKPYVLGMGCKKGKSFEALQTFALEELQKEGIAMDQVAALASIDLKQGEMGLEILACFYHLPFYIYGADDLQEVEGQFSESAFVSHVTGVSNVCERAALACAGQGGRLLVKKQAKDGMTFALAKQIPRIQTWQTNVSK